MCIITLLFGERSKCLIEYDICGLDILLRGVRLCDPELCDRSWRCGDGQARKDGKAGAIPQGGQRGQVFILGVP